MGRTRDFINLIYTCDEVVQPSEEIESSICVRLLGNHTTGNQLLFMWATYDHSLEIS